MSKFHLLTQENRVFYVILADQITDIGYEMGL